MSPPDDIASRLENIRARIARAALTAGRRPGDIRLVAVSKTVEVDRLRAAAAAGQQDFGESRVQEALQKRSQTADLLIRWHLIGPLQTNKVRKAVELFAWIHSVDSIGLLKRLDTAATELGTHLNVLVQVDLAGEPTRHGAPRTAVPSIFEAALGCRSAQVVGLMVLPPWFEDPEHTRPYFRQLRELRDRLGEDGVPAEMLRELSMGMSHDFEVAVEEGSTAVRVGSAVFGTRAV